MSLRVCLASGSPRRKMLLESLGWHVDVCVSNADETWPVLPPEEAVVQIACRKLACAPVSAYPVVAADTVVFLNGAALGKPADTEQAHAMLRALSDAEHAVYTGFAVSYQGRVVSQAVCTRVCFKPLSDQEIVRYIAAEKPFDKAGAYGIQEGGGHFVRWMQGSYTNVIGLPLYEVQSVVESFL